MILSTVTGSSSVLSISSTQSLETQYPTWWVLQWDSRKKPLNVTKILFKAIWTPRFIFLFYLKNIWWKILNIRSTDWNSLNSLRTASICSRKLWKIDYDMISIYIINIIFQGNSYKARRLKGCESGPYCNRSEINLSFLFYWQVFRILLINLVSFWANIMPFNFKKLWNIMNPHSNVVFKMNWCHKVLMTEEDDDSGSQYSVMCVTVN